MTGIRKAASPRPLVRELLTALATGRLPLTHDGRAGNARPIAARYLRHELMACGILPTVDKHLLETGRWLHRRLAELVDHPHQPLLRRFAPWHQLPDSAPPPQLARYGPPPGPTSPSSSPKLICAHAAGHRETTGRLGC
ncbi:hypothetical protein [Micromonospora taraxaci]